MREFGMNCFCHWSPCKICWAKLGYRIIEYMIRSETDKTMISQSLFVLKTLSLINFLESWTNSCNHLKDSSSVISNEFHKVFVLTHNLYFLPYLWTKYFTHSWKCVENDLDWKVFRAATYLAVLTAQPMMLNDRHTHF